MISSILDNDLYKFTMQQAVHMLYPRAEADYVFINRGETPFPAGYANQLQKQIDKMSALRLTRSEKEYLASTCYFLTPVYLDFLEHYIYDPNEVKIDQDLGELRVTIRGPWYKTILWEVPIMALISQLYFELTGAIPHPRDKQRSLNQGKSARLAENRVNFAEFGTRRRYSFDHHQALIMDMLDVEDHTLIGTSNVYLARKFNIKPIGTQAHEWFMFHAAMNGYRMANLTAVDAWIKAYHGDLGIALTDTYTTDIFLRTFDTMHAKLFDGVRQDSGDPFEFVDKIIRHYETLHIDPTTKTVVFSDGLDVDKAVSIHQYCRGRIRDAYGIGTHLTNDVGVPPLNMVIKLAKCRTAGNKEWQHVIKLSDSRNKYTGDREELNHCRKVLERSIS